MNTEKTRLCDLIPHHGTMCLLDNIEQWDEERVICNTLTHTHNDNPLRRNGHLHIVHALEYGAQAMAVHGGLLAQQKQEAIRPGYLVAVRNAKFHIDHLDTILTSLTVEAHQLLESGGSLIYEFTISNGDDILAEARATVITEKEADK